MEMLQLLFVVNVLMSSKYFVSVHCLKFSESTDNDLNTVATILSSKYFSGVNCVSLITEYSVKPTLDYYIQHIKPTQLTSRFIIHLDENEQESCNDELIQNIINKSYENACTNYIVQLENPHCFFSTWKLVAKKSRQRYNPRIMFLPTEKTNMISAVLLKSNMTEFIADMIMVDMYPKQTSDNPTGFKALISDWNTKSQIVADCTNSGCVEYSPVFPRKIINLNKKVLNVATFNYPPYTILEPSEGTEGRIVLEYARIYNCSINIVTDGYQWGQIHENGSGNGVLGNVAEGKADIGIGALYQWFHEYQFLDFSVPYIRSGVTCLAPKPKLLSTALLPTRPFNLITWIIVVCILLSACAALYLIKKLDVFLLGSKGRYKHQRHHYWFTTKADTALRTFGFLVLQASSNRTIETSSIRHLVNWLHVMFMLVATSYNSGLASILTVPSYQPPLDTATDLVNSQLQWGATHDAWIFSLREASEPQLKTLVSRFKALPSEQLHKKSLSENFAFSIERLPAGHFAVGEYINEESMKHLRLMKQDIYYENCVIVFQKGSPYLSSFNTLIQRLSASGLLLFWEGEVARKFLHTNVQSAIRDSSIVIYQAYVIPIQFSHLLGPFILLGVGLSLALFTFILELNMILFHKRPKKREVRWNPVIETNIYHF